MHLDSENICNSFQKDDEMIDTLARDSHRDTDPLLGAGRMNLPCSRPVPVSQSEKIWDADIQKARLEANTKVSSICCQRFAF